MRDNYRGNNRPPVVLNVAEKPSVARALAGVFCRLEGARDKGMRREANQIFTHENVCFPNVMIQHQQNNNRLQNNTRNHHHQGRVNRGAGKSDGSQN